ncbi:MAG: type II toxin-antitoxin system RelE/ParE family toxin [Cyanobacteria bacterium J06628_6]
MKFEIAFAPEALEDLAGLRAADRAKVLDAIEVHLSYEPEKISKSRIKRLRELDHSQYRLRVDDIRVFYDVIYTVDAGSVEILAIKSKADSIKWLTDFGDN